MDINIRPLTPFYFTFGQRYNLRMRYMIVRAENAGSAREIMVNRYGPHWAFQYTHAEFQGQVEKYGIREIEFGAEVIDESAKS